MSAIDRDFWAGDLTVELDASGITAAVVVQTSNSLAETADLLAASMSERILGVVGWVDLSGDVPEQLEALSRLPGGENLVGIRHLAHQDPDPAWLARPEIGAGFEDLGAAGLPFDLVISSSQLKYADEAVRAHPGVRFILDHLAKPAIRAGELATWRTDLATLARHSNVCAKLSGLTIEAGWSTWTLDSLRPVIEHALTTFGASRLMFGSDWPLVNVAGGLPRWIEAVRSLIPEAHASGILAMNALSAYGRTPQ